MIKSRVHSHRSLASQGEIVERGVPQWPGFVLSGHRHEPLEALHDHVVGWPRHPRPGVPRIRDHGVN